MMAMNDANRLRDLQFRAKELGVAVAMCQVGELEIVARELSRIIDGVA